jgi:hypothetical protein
VKLIELTKALARIVEIDREPPTLLDEGVPLLAHLFRSLSARQSWE